MNTMEWVFSGIGVLILSLIIDRFVIKKGKFSKKKTNIIKDINMINSKSNTFQIIEHQEQHLYQAKQEVSETILITNISPTEIKKTIETAALFQQDKIAKNYIGLNVVWQLRLFSIYEKGQSLEILFLEKNELFPDVKIITTIEKHPIFKIAKKDALFEVSGKIIDCQLYSIHLETRSIKELN
jgi:hypothetical protein